MATPYHHALSSAKRFGGTWRDYIDVHSWFDASKAFMGDFRHRALRHHAEGIFECEKAFGKVLTLMQRDENGNISGGTFDVPTRLVGEQHVIEDCGFIPTMQDWFSHIKPQVWMNQPKKLSRELTTPCRKEPCA